MCRDTAKIQGATTTRMKKTGCGRSRGLIRAVEIAWMRPVALLLNTSRDPSVDETTRLKVRREQHFQVGRDVFSGEPLGVHRPLRRLTNVTPTPHLGAAVEEGGTSFYPQSVENVRVFLDGQPICIVNP